MHGRLRHGERHRDRRADGLALPSRARAGPRRRRGAESRQPQRHVLPRPARREDGAGHRRAAHARHGGDARDRRGHGRRCARAPSTTGPSTADIVGTSRAMRQRIRGAHAARGLARDGARRRRVGRRQGAHRARAPRRVARRHRAVRRRQLRRHPARARGQRALRPPEGRVHRRAARRAAARSRRADGGTLFLDEIGELPLDIQPMLLRALETGDVRPVGGDSRTAREGARRRGDQPRICETEVREGRFREDLYYRLAVVRCTSRRCASGSRTSSRSPRLFARAAGLDALPRRRPRASSKARAWPGNARELRNAVQAVRRARHAAAAASRRKAAARCCALANSSSTPRAPVRRAEGRARRRVQRGSTSRPLLARTSGEPDRGGPRSAGVDRTYLGRLLAKYGMGK